MSDGVFHCDAESREALFASRPRTLVFGSYSGYANFGDVLQLMGTLRWHRDGGEVDPVVVCDADSISDAAFVERLRARLRPAPVLFFSEAAVDLRPVGLEALREVPRISVLHVYGGGFLNGIWGAQAVRRIEAIHDRFRVARYVLSGQQVGPELGDTLTRHFARFPPFLAGARDDLSLEVLRRCGVEAFASFDDGFEAAAVLADRLGARAPRAAGSAALHLNLSAYSGDGDSASRRSALADRLARIHSWLEARPGVPRVTLLQAYDDRRPEILDTLSVVKELEDTFPFSDARVLDLVPLAFDPWGSSATRGLDAEVALCGSHHVALLCALLGIPCFLQADNAFYRQKRTGLGARSTHLEAFLEDPDGPRLDRVRRRRASWCRQLADAIRTAPEPRSTSSAKAPVDATASSFRPKPGAADGAALIAAMADERSRLECDRDEARREAAAWRREAEDLRSWLAERERTITWFRTQSESWKKIADERSTAIESLRRWIDEQAEARRWLDDQRQGWLSVARVREDTIRDQQHRIRALEKVGLRSEPADGGSPRPSGQRAPGEAPGRGGDD